MKKIKICVLFFAMFASSQLFSQNPVMNKTEHNGEPKYEEYQFYLKDPAIKILDIQIDNDCSPVRGKLSENGKTVFIKDYKEHSRIYIKFLKADAKVEELTKSPCFIDPVVNAL